MCILSIIIIINFNVIILIIIILILIIIILLQTNINKVNMDMRQPCEICSIEHTWLFCLFSGYFCILLLYMTIFWMSGNFVVEWNYFWLKLSNYFCWMKIIRVEVEQILLLNEIIFGWSWTNIFVEWNYVWLKLNKYFCWMKIILVEIERKCALLNINIKCWI